MLHHAPGLGGTSLDRAFAFAHARSLFKPQQHVAAPRTAPKELQEWWHDALMSCIPPPSPSSSFKKQGIPNSARRWLNSMESACVPGFTSCHVHFKKKQLHHWGPDRTRPQGPQERVFLTLDFPQHTWKSKGPSLLGLLCPPHRHIGSAGAGRGNGHVQAIQQAIPGSPPEPGMGTGTAVTGRRRGRDRQRERNWSSWVSMPGLDTDSGPRNAKEGGWEAIGAGLGDTRKADTARQEDQGPACLGLPPQHR